jgi:hypothetical protein
VRRWRGGDQVLVRLGSPGLSDASWVRGRVLRAPCEAREGIAVTVDCEDGWRRFVEPERLKPLLRVVRRDEG